MFSGCCRLLIATAGTSASTECLEENKYRNLQKTLLSNGKQVMDDHWVTTYHMYQKNDNSFLFLGVIFLLILHTHEPSVNAVYIYGNNTFPIPSLRTLKQRERTLRNGPISNMSHEFTIMGDYFMLDKNKFQILSGSIHYFRIPKEYWQDRLMKLKSAGFNTVATYVEWSYHEPEERQYRFTGDHDIAEFIRLAAQEGLWVLLRPGPYICADRSLGGLPYWLLSNSHAMTLRTTHGDFITETFIWMKKLFEHLSPLLAGNGGPIIMVQVENEFRSYRQDVKYIEMIRDIIEEHVGNKAVLYASETVYQEQLQKGAVPRIINAVDFGVEQNLRTAFVELRLSMPTGPLMNSEFYTGWVNRWGMKPRQVAKYPFVRILQDMINNEINVNVYMFCGGTNFGFSAGSSFENSFYSSYITSYDYDAPLNEAGDPTAKYYAIRRLMEMYIPDLKNVDLPTSSRKKACGTVQLERQFHLLSPFARSRLGKVYPDVRGSFRPTFEQLRQKAGFILYETPIHEDLYYTMYNEGLTLEIHKPRDRVYVFLNGELRGIITRGSKDTYTLGMKVAQSPQRVHVLSLLVEPLGRISYGARIHDYKGILGTVLVNKERLDQKWLVTGFPLENIDANKDFMPSTSEPLLSSGATFYKGYFTVRTQRSTYLNPFGWKKGYAWVNGHNLGCYWPDVGPQITLYVPGVWLKLAPAQNSVVILELVQPPENLTVTFTNLPILDYEMKKTAPQLQNHSRRS